MNTTVQQVAKKVGSAIRTAYFMIFFLATANVLLTTWQRYRLDVDQYLHGDLDRAMVLLVMFAFVFAVSLHGARLYLTLEMLEERHPPFDNYLVDVQGWRRDLEFLCRLAIVLIVTNKAFGQWNSLNDVLLYASLATWSILAWLFLNLSWKRSYGTMSFLGLIGAISLTWLHSQLATGNVTTFCIAAVVLELTIFYSLATDLKANWRCYYEFVILKLPQRFRTSAANDDGAQAMLIENLLLLLIASVTLYYCGSIYYGSKHLYFGLVTVTALLTGAVAVSMLTQSFTIRVCRIVPAVGAVVIAAYGPAWLRGVNERDLYLFAGLVIFTIAIIRSAAFVWRHSARRT
jgi:hypothetical protein